MKNRLLIIDDEANMLALFRRLFRGDEFEVMTALDGAAALALVQEHDFDVIVTDQALPDAHGLDLLELFRRQQPDVPIIVVTAFGTIASAVEAMRRGAFDYLTKPFQRDEIKLTVEKALRHSALSREVARLRREVAARNGFDNMVGKSKAMRGVFELLEKVADSNATILILGESGTGKELVARGVHYRSRRKEGPFVTIDCGVLPGNLLESELFGHVKGAFTGAMRSKVGLFAEADGGTLFLDEVSTISLTMQAKLLRAIQEREIRPVGSNQSAKVDVRIMAASNEDLREKIRTGGFREDLYYRLSVVPVNLPPLRDRREDIPLLAEHFLRKFVAETGRMITGFSPRALQLLIDYPWPGNVRELENMIERLVLTSDAEEIGAVAFPAELSGTPAPVVRPAPQSLKEVGRRESAALERQAIIDALRRAGGNKSGAARLLKISRGTLYSRIRELDLEASSWGQAPRTKEKRLKEK